MQLLYPGVGYVEKNRKTTQRLSTEPDLRQVRYREDTVYSCNYLLKSDKFSCETQAKPDGKISSCQGRFRSDTKLRVRLDVLKYRCMIRYNDTV